MADAGIRSNGSGIEYLWFRGDDGRMRLLGLHRLVYIPVAAREDPDVMGKAWAMLRGLYAARVDFAYLAAGIWTPRPVGILQFYGALAEGADEDEARAELRRRMNAVVAAFRAAYPQSRLLPAETDDLRWLLEAITNFPHALALLGQPSPRAAPRGLGRDGKVGAEDDEFASQQNEVLFRGLAALKRDFLFQFFADRLDRKMLARQLEEVAHEAGLWASRVRGTRSIGLSVGIPVMGAVARAVSAGRGYATGETDSTAHTDSQSTSTAHTKAWSHTDSYARSEGGFESWGTATTSGSSYSRSVAHTTSQATTEGTAHTDSHAVTDGTAHTTGSSTSVTTSSGSSWSVSDTTSSGWSAGVSLGTSSSHTDGWTHQESTGGSQATTVSGGYSHTDGTANSYGASFSADLTGGLQPAGVGGLGGSVGGALSASTTDSSSNTYSSGVAQSAGTSWSQADATSGSDTTGHSVGVSMGISGGEAHTESYGGFSSTSVSSSSFSSDTVSHSETRGTADTTSHSETRGTAETTGESWGSFSSTTNSYSHGRSWAETWGRADSYGEADTTGESRGTADSTGHADSVARSQQTGAATSGGWSFGLVPTWSAGRTWQVEEDQMDQVARLQRLVEAALERAVAEGAYRASAFLLLRDEDAVKAAEALAVSAFHGVDVPTPVIPVRGQCADRHARRLEPCRCPDPIRHPLGGSALGSVLTFEQAAAYAAPGLFEEGVATTMQEALPPLAFYPPRDGILLGHQFSPETGDLTDTPLLLPRERYSHAAFVADTRFGKSVAAERLALESTVAWQMRTIVLDFGAGWRKLLNAPQLSGHADFYSLSPGSPRPLRWNPLQIGRRIHPETQWRAFCDIFSAISKMGVRRQGPELREALRQVYLRAGVLVDDPALPPEWGEVLPDEADVIRRARAERGLPDEDRTGWPLSALEGFERQALAVHRSRRVGLADLYAEVEQKLQTVPARDTTMRGVLEGILYRLHPLVQGMAARQYAPGADTVALEDLGLPWGLVVVEGGADLDEFSKAFLLGWLAWMLWRDAVARRQAGQKLQPMQIIFEEANKILNGPQVASDSEEGGGDYVAEQFALMWRDSAKYQCYLHVIAQSPSLLPRGILSSCSLAFVGQLKDPNDAKIAMAMLERSEVGFVDEPYRRLIRRLGVGQFLARLAYGEMSQLEPVLIRPAMVRLPEPTDEEIAAMFP